MDAGARRGAVNTSATWIRLGIPLALLGVLAACAVASAGGPPEYITGDLVVTGGAPQVWSNRTVVLTGNLTVGSGAQLTMVNSTLQFVLPANGTYGLMVQAGGTLQLLDVDGVPSTAGDRSSISSATLGHRFAATFEAGSNVWVRASEVRDFGFSAVVPGLLIRSSNVTFEGAVLGAYAFLKVDGASPRFVATTLDGGGQGSNYFYGSSAQLVNCTLLGHLVALGALQGSSLEVDGALFRDLAFALAVNGSTVRVADSALVNATQGVFLTNASLADLVDVDLGASPLAFGDSASEVRYARAFTALVLNQALEPVRNATVEFRAAGGALMASGPTGSEGTFGPVPLAAYNETSLGRTVALNYTVNATRAANSTGAAFSALTESGQVTLSLVANLDPRVTLVRPAPGAVLLASVAATFEAAVTDPDDTPGGLTVTWREATLGTLGTGTTASVALPAGDFTVTVEVRDGDGGFRSLAFAVHAVLPVLRTFTDGADPPVVRFTAAKAPAGEFLVAGAPGAPLPVLAVGTAWEVHPATGTVVWANGTLVIGYGGATLPYGVDLSSLTIARFNGTAWNPLPGTFHDALSRTVRAEVTPATGLGRFAIVATAAAPVPPEVDPIPLLVAVRGVPFSYPVVARDTPGQVLNFSLAQAPPWVRVDAASGLITGTAGEADRGRLAFMLFVGDGTGEVANQTVEVFVTSSADNAPPVLANPTAVPARPVAGGEVTLQVTYFDPDDDAPVVIEVLVDGRPVAMEALDATDIYTDDGKLYVARVTMEAGVHNVTFRTTDGAPGHGDVTLLGPQVEAYADPIAAVNNTFLALFVSAALTFAFIVYMGVTRRPEEEKPDGKATEPEGHVEFLQGESLGRIAPQPPLAKAGKAGKEDGLETEAGTAAEKAEAIAREVDEVLDGKRP